MDGGKQGLGVGESGGRDVGSPRHERPAPNLLLLVVFPNVPVKFLPGVLHIAEAALAHSLLFKHRQGAGACRQKLPAWECCSADTGETRAPEHRGDDSNEACVCHKRL